jgi:3D (Asp-Asp-Asp) domain-containing protein
MKDFKSLIALSLLGFVICSCSPTKSSLTTRATGYSSRVNEEGASAYSQKFITPPTIRSSQVRRVRTTSYSHAENEKGGIYGRKNAIGITLKYGVIRSAAADWSRYPLGTKFRIIGQPYMYVIDDYGSALVGTDTIDIYKPNLSMMKDWGVRELDIEILEWGSYKQSLSVLASRTHVADHCREMYDRIKPKI